MNVNEREEKEVCKISKTDYTIFVKVPENSFSKEDFCKLIYQYALDELKNI